MSLAKETNAARAEALLQCAAEYGINFVDLGYNPMQIPVLSAILDSTGLSDRFYRLYEFRGDNRAAFDAFLDLAASRDDDFILLSFPDEASLSRLKNSGILDAAEDAVRSGRIGHYGFSAPCDPEIIADAAENHDGWDFYRIDYSFLTPGLEAAITQAALNELGFIAADPFAGGLLENPGNAAHEFYRNAPVPRSHAEWALRAIWEKQEAVTVLWEGSAEALIPASIYAEAGRPNSLPGKELSVLDNVRKTLDTTGQIQQS